MKITGSRALMECLKREGVDTIFGYPGGAVIPIYDAIYQFPDIQHILVRHEQGAGHMAEGYALATGKVGVCLATSGPGATNLVTPIADAMMDSVPLVAITGQVQDLGHRHRRLPGSGHHRHHHAHHQAQLAGQRCHQAARRSLPRRSISPARAAPDPFWWTFPWTSPTPTLSTRRCEEVNIPTYKPTTKGHSRQIQRAAELIAEAQRPVLYVGGGAIYSGADDEVQRTGRADRHSCHHDPQRPGRFPETHPLSLGMLGMHGTAYANYAVSECDLLIAVGARFDDRVTGKADEWVQGRKIIHIDVDPAEIGKVLTADVPIVGDVKADPDRTAESRRARRLMPTGTPTSPSGSRTTRCTIPHDGILHGQYVIEQIGEVSNHDGIVVTDVGQHQMWAAQFYKCRRPRQFVTSGGLGTMGFGLPAAIGAQFGRPDKPVFCVSGDGSIQMCIQELMVATVYKLPIKICILNNEYLGMVRQWQELFWESHYSNVNLEASPDFVKLAEAYGAHAIRCSKPSRGPSRAGRSHGHHRPPDRAGLPHRQRRKRLPDDQVRRHDQRHGRPAPAGHGAAGQLHGQRNLHA